MIKMAGPSKTVVNLGPVVGEWTMAKGLNSADLEKLLGLDKDPEMRGHGAKFLAFLVKQCSGGLVPLFSRKVKELLPMKVLECNSNVLELP